MTKNEKDTLLELRGMMSAEKENMDIPRSLTPESIVRAVSKSGQGEVIPITDGRRNDRYLRRAAAMVAALAFIVIGALGMKVINQRSVGKDSAQIMLGDVRRAGNYDEIKQILLGRSNGKSGSAVLGFTSAADKSAGEAELSEAGYTTGEANAVTIPAGNEVKQEEVRAASSLEADGSYLYLAGESADSETGEVTSGISITDRATMETVSFIPFLKSGGVVQSVRKITLTGDVLAVAVSRQGSEPGKESAVLLYNVKDRLNPSFVKEISQCGNYLTSVVCADRYYLISVYDIAAAEEMAADSFAPVYYAGGSRCLVRAEDIFCGIADPESSYLVITSTDMTDLEAQPVGQAILGCGRDIYLSSSSIIAKKQAGGEGGFTGIYCFAMTRNGIVFSGNAVENTSQPSQTEAPSTESSTAAPAVTEETEVTEETTVAAETSVTEEKAEE